MRKLIPAFAILLFTSVAALAPAASAAPPSKPLKIVLSRQSNVDPVEIVKNFNRKCPNVTVTTNPKDSDYMLNAAVGWGGGYRFLIIAHGGDTLYATETTLLSNAVKDVCKYLNSRP
jgi:hypothetical protein